MGGSQTTRIYSKSKGWYTSYLLFIHRQTLGLCNELNLYKVHVLVSPVEYINIKVVPATPYTTGLHGLLSVYCLFTVCLLSVYCLSTVCLLYIYCLFTVCLLSVYCTSYTTGLQGLYRGAIPNAQRAAVVNGVQIPTYDVTKRNLLAADFQVSPTQGNNNNFFIYSKIQYNYESNKKYGNSGDCSRSVP